jgi:hypothetical protein
MQKRQGHTTAEKLTISGFKSGATNRINAPLLPICIRNSEQHHKMTKIKTMACQNHILRE